jgi:hypothetical protein
MTVRRLLVMLALLAMPAGAAAQVVNGLAEWTVSRGTVASDTDENRNNSFWQNYTVGYSAPLFDPRLMTYTGELSFRTSSQTTGSSGALQHGYRSDTGYKLGASLFPRRPFPLTLQLSRGVNNESGNYPSSSAVRGGIVVPQNEPVPDFRTLSTSRYIGWQLNLASLPQVDLGYRSDASVITGGPYDAEQLNGDVHSTITHGTERTRQVLRYERTSFENRALQAFDQRISDLAYDATITTGARSRIIARVGRRRTFSLFDLPQPIVDSGTGAYTPPARGDVTSVYAIAGVTMEPIPRVAVDVTGSVDRQGADTTETSARLATASGRYDVGRGLQIDGVLTYGERAQVIAGSPLTVRTRSAAAGASYRVGRPWLEATVGGNRGSGVNTTFEGERGSHDAWSAQTTIASTVRWLSVGAGAERIVGHDDLLDYGNYRGWRRRMSLQVLVNRGAISSSWDDTRVDRGRGATFARLRQQTFTGVVTYRVMRDTVVSGSAGGFTSDGDIGRDRTIFVGGGFNAHPQPPLQILGWIRQEQVVASQVRLDQRTFAWLAQADYQIGLFSVGIEYRYNGNAVQYEGLLAPYVLRGRQLRFTIARRFAFSR